MATHNWPGFGLASVSCSLDRPATVNRSRYTGVRSVATNPWHGKWSFKVQLATMQGDGAFQAARAFFTSLKGQVDNFHLPAVEAPQNANTGVTVEIPGAAGVVSLQVTATTLAALVVGNMMTVNGQLLSLTAVGAVTISAGAGHQTVTFEPPLRAAAAFGTSVETAKPYALVALSSSDFAWDIGQWRRYGLSFDCEEAIGDTDGASSSGDVWNATFTSTGGVVPAATINLTVKDEGSALGSAFSTLNFIGGAVAATDVGGGQANITVTGGSDETIYLKDHGFIADNATVNSAAAVEALIAALPGNRGAVIHGGLGVTRFDRHIRPDRPCIFDGYGRGDEEDLDTDVPTCFSFPRGTGAFEFYPAAIDSWVKNARVTYYGTAPRGDGVATFSGSGTGLTGVSPAANFANDDTVLIEGMGPSIGVVGTAATISSGSNVATIVTTAVDYLGNTASLGNPGVYVGQRNRTAGAGAAGADLNSYVGAWTSTTVTHVDASGAAVNAGTSVTAALYTIWMPVITKIVSGGGTATPTFDHFPNTMSAVTGAPMRHCDVEILARTKVNTSNVCLLPGSAGSGGTTIAGGGIGLLCSGITSDGTVADNGQHYDLKSQGQNFAAIYFQGNDAQLNAFHGGDGSGPKLAIGEASILGNYFFAFAGAFGVFVQIGFAGAETVFFQCYNEAGTRIIASNQSRAAAYSCTSMRGGSGISVFDSSSVGDEVVVLPSLYSPQIVANNGLAAIGGRASFLGGNGNFTPLGYNGNGVLIGTIPGANTIQSLISGSAGACYLQASLFHFGNTASGGAQFGTLDANAFDHPAAFRVNGTKVVGARDTGWSADTGTARKAANATYVAGTTLTYSATYVQSEQTAMATRMAAVEAALQNIAQTQKALKDAAIAAGSIGA